MLTCEELREEVKKLVVENLYGQAIEKINKRVDVLLDEPEFQELMQEILAKRNTPKQNQSPEGPAETCED